ncbi:MAG: DinB family protein [Planctomycetota bacterium]|jgi:hypothetical protein
MDWKKFLKGQVEYTFGVTENLIALVEEGDLDWMPETGANWMTTAQLLKHVSNACGSPCKGFVLGDWGIPEGADLSAEDMLPSADKLPGVKSVGEARTLLAADKALALEMIDRAADDALATQPAPAPWDPSEVPLGERLLQMVVHLESHKAQLFYYLKLQGKPVNTSHLWGGPPPPEA